METALGTGHSSRAVPPLWSLKWIVVADREAVRLARSSVTASERAVARLQDRLTALDAALADPHGRSYTSPADLMRERAGIAADLEDAELQWLDAQEQLEKAEG